MQPAEAAESRRADRTIQAVLRVGLALALCAMIAGVALRAGGGMTDARSVKLFELFSARLDAGERLIALGILALALTPAVRVLALLFLWARARDWRFVAVATIVAVTLGFGVLLGRG